MIILIKDMGHCIVWKKGIHLRSQTCTGVVMYTIFICCNFNCNGLDYLITCVI